MSAQDLKPRPKQKATAKRDESKAAAWAETAVAFVANQHLLERFQATDSAQRFQPLVPPSSINRISGGIGEDGGRLTTPNPQNGIIGLEYELASGSNGLAKVSWVDILLPRTDPDGVDVISRVMAAMKRKLRATAWKCIPYPDNGLTCNQERALLTVSVETEQSVPARDGTPNAGPWVILSFGHVEGFVEP